MNIFKRKNRHQRGEVASLLTIVSMLVITAGIVIGTQINQASRPISTTPFAVDAPTPIDLGYTGGRWFDGSQGMICAAEFTCNSDPLIQKLEIRSLDGSQKLDLGVDVTGRGNPNGTPVGKSITGACSNRAYGISVNWDPRIDYTDAQKANIRKATGYDIKKGQILLSVRQGPSDHKYFVYDRPSWLTGGEDALFYFEFDAKTAGVTRRYSQIAKGKKGCGPETTVTPTGSLSGTPSVTPTGPLSGTPSVTPTPTNWLITIVVKSPTPTPTKSPTPTNIFVTIILKSPTPTPSCGGPTCPPPSITPTPSCGGPTCPPTATPSTPLSGTPSVTPTPITATSCSFSALVYVQECTQFNAQGQCVRDARGNFMARALSTAELTNFGTINNKQLAGGRYGQGPASRFNLFTGNPIEAADIIKNYPYYGGGILGSQLSYFRADLTQPVPAGVNPVASGNGMFIPPTFTYPNERYANMEDASIRLTLKRPDYRIVPEGNEIKFCKNNIKGNTVGACNLPAFQANRIDNSVDLTKRDPRDTVTGLTVGCGQNIVYGWTVQKCNADFDYIFVMDTSTSMIKTRDRGGELKKDAAMKELQDFLTNIKNSGGDHRAALIQFSSRRNTRIVTPLTNNIDTVKNDATNSLTYEEGTCIECGLRETMNLLTNFRTDKSRRVVVVFLSDGLPNSDPGNPRAGGYEAEIKTEADKLKAMNTAATGNVPPTVIGIGYGDPNAANNPVPGELVNAELLRVIKVVASDDTWAFSTAANVSISEIFGRVQQSLNSCAQTEALHTAFMRAKDMNDDGIINTVDLFNLYDAYFQQGTELPGDLNDDGVINSLDVSLMIGDLGTVVSPELESQ
jgi:hypothetical protein